MRIILDHYHYGRVIMANGEIWTNWQNRRYAGFITSSGIFVNLPIEEVMVIAS